ncbi:MAG TPA: DUF924 family protein [Ramlibacter sp.]|jgi:uncharacterized protein (DUF924 family)
MALTGTPAQAAEVVAFWRAAGPQRWFRKDEAFDADFRQRFLALHEQAATGALNGWAGDAEGALALLILLDQFPRNAFRGSARTYATDRQALAIARTAIARGLDTQVAAELQGFFVLPLMHSEDPADQALSVEKSAPLGGDTHRFALHHQDIIRRFGRFPHRNAILGRASTPAEEQFIAEGGFAG